MIEYKKVMSSCRCPCHVARRARFYDVCDEAPPRKSLHIFSNFIGRTRNREKEFSFLSFVFDISQIGQARSAADIILLIADETCLYDVCWCNLSINVIPFNINIV